MKQLPADPLDTRDGVEVAVLRKDRSVVLAGESGDPKVVVGDQDSCLSACS
ncbi:MAG TPA: hypothetical protein VJ952_07165 [Opitutales bacterium]|nr:hypothetical protein [Opitutales bacterium]